MKNVLFVVNDMPFFISHRLPLALSLKELGLSVHVATPVCENLNILKNKYLSDISYHEIVLSRGSSNPIKELLTIISLFRLYKKVNPDLVHLVTVKPVLYGSILAKIMKIPSVVLAISGLGAVFIKSSFKMRIVSNLVAFLYRFAFSHNKMRVIFQNNDDLKTLSQLAELSQSKVALVSGSGVDLEKYSYVEEPNEECIKVAMVSRLLKDKGVLEYVEAARILKNKNININFLLVGDIDRDNPASITNEQIAVWRNEGIVEILGYSTEVHTLFASTNMVVLPSYREGSPKVLAEAAACGRAVVTTDVPGCRDTIIANKTGLLVPVKNAKALAEAIELLAKDSSLRKNMGKEGRKLAENEFNVKKIVADHIKIYESLDLFKTSVQ